MRLTAQARFVPAIAMATLTGILAMWLYTYKAWVEVEYIDLRGREFHPAGRTTVQPGWIPLAVVLVVLVGTALTMRLAPQRPRPLGGLARYFARIAGTRPLPRA